MLPVHRSGAHLPALPPGRRHAGRVLHLGWIEARPGKAGGSGGPSPFRSLDRVDPSFVVRVWQERRLPFSPDARSSDAKPTPIRPAGCLVAIEWPVSELSVRVPPRRSFGRPSMQNWAQQARTRYESELELARMASGGYDGRIARTPAMARRTVRTEDAPSKTTRTQVMCANFSRYGATSGVPLMWTTRSETRAARCTSVGGRARRKGGCARKDEGHSKCMTRSRYRQGSQGSQKMVVDRDEWERRMDGVALSKQDLNRRVRGARIASSDPSP